VRELLVLLRTRTGSLRRPCSAVRAPRGCHEHSGKKPEARSWGSEQRSGDSVIVREDGAAINLAAQMRHRHAKTRSRT
jgi:hypothetical protein